MTRIPFKALAAVALLVATTAPVSAYEGWQVGTWTHTATVDDHEVKVTLDLTANTIHCTIRTKEGSATWTLTVEADYVLSRDGVVVGILAPGKASPKEKKDDSKERTFTCRITAEKDGIVVSDVAQGGGYEEQAKKVLEGRYRKSEGKTATARSKSKEPVVAPASASPPPPPRVSE
jgi:hypothetical protein